MKKYADWDCDLDVFLQIGDVVDREFVDYFINVLPPAFWNDRIVQMGEPYSHRDGKATYATLKNTGKGWVYAGHCFRGQTENIL